jgi:hypothetical protein
MKMKIAQSIGKYLLVITAVALLAAGCNQAANQTENQNTNEPAKAETNSSKQANEQISYQGEEGKTALEILKAKYDTKTQEFTGVGEFVQSINGVVPQSNFFWAFYVNGQSSNVGAGQYKTKSTDKIEWRLEEIK